jgi:hypothetical protein
MKKLKKTIFSLTKDIRYVAIYVNGNLISSERPCIKNTSSSDSDKYEELIVNPTLLKLVTQRGNIDCDGIEFVIIKYGSFFELVMPVKEGHLSVGIEHNSDLMTIVNRIQLLVKDYLMNISK